LSFVRGLGGELILLLSVFIEEINSLNNDRDTRSAAPTASFFPLGDQVMAATFLMLSSKGMTFPEYLSFMDVNLKISKHQPNSNISYADMNCHGCLINRTVRIILADLKMELVLK
jgi:hypothetical protein